MVQVLAVLHRARHSDPLLQGSLHRPTLAQPTTTTTAPPSAGLDVVGLYLLCPAPAFAASATQLAALAEAAAKELSGRLPSLLVLHIDSVSGGLALREAAVRELRPAELKVAPLLDQLVMLQSRCGSWAGWVGGWVGSRWATGLCRKRYAWPRCRYTAGLALAALLPPHPPILLPTHPPMPTPQV